MYQTTNTTQLLGTLIILLVSLQTARINVVGKLLEAHSCREESPSGKTATLDALRSFVQPDASVKAQKLPNRSVSF
jgi:hypothetical protein